jgi:hypothetical protein
MFYLAASCAVAGVWGCALGYLYNFVFAPWLDARWKSKWRLD